MTDHEDPVHFFSEFAERLALLGRVGKGFFDQHMFPCFESAASQFEVGARGRSDHDCIDLGIVEDFAGIRAESDIRKTLGGGIEPRFVSVDDTSDSAAAAGVKIGDQIRAPMPSAYNRHSDHVLSFLPLVPPASKYLLASCMRRKNLLNNGSGKAFEV